jgi:hypothetical protein
MHCNKHASLMINRQAEPRLYYSMIKFFEPIRTNRLSFVLSQESVAGNAANPGNFRFLLSQESVAGNVANPGNFRFLLSQE